jgi:hypothetical protein
MSTTISYFAVVLGTILADVPVGMNLGVFGCCRADRKCTH